MASPYFKNFQQVNSQIGLLIFLWLFSFTGYSQNDQNHKIDIVKDELAKRDTISEVYKPEKSIQVFPTLFYTPETNFGFGFASLAIFKMSKTNEYLQFSSIQVSANYSLNNQTSVYLKHELNFTAHYLTRGELGFYYFPDIYAREGSNHSVTDFEWFSAYYPRIKIDLLRRSKKHFIYGLRYWYQNTTMTEIQQGGFLDTQKPVGYMGSVLSGIGIVLNYDSRNFIFAPTHGWYSEFSVMVMDKFTGATFKDLQFLYDVRKYIPIRKKNSIALQFTSEIHFGTPAFNHQAVLGGEYSMRGYRRGIYRDLTNYVLQAEFRSAKFFKFFSGAIFASTGGVGNTYIESYQNAKFSYGVGLWVFPQPKKRLFVRFDYGRSLEPDHSQGFYVSMGNAF